jgi:hypothetical protein
MTYTLKVPISSSGYFPNSIGTRPGATVVVTIESSNNRSIGRSTEQSGEGGGGGVGALPAGVDLVAVEVMGEVASGMEGVVRRLKENHSASF